MSIPDSVLSNLQKYWGYNSLRPIQAEVVDAALRAEDALVVMPTGGGKSLCFQLPALEIEGLSLVVSPLIALMKDQVDGLRLIGYPAAVLNSTLDHEEEAEVVRKVASGQVRLLYTSPERIVSAGTLSMLTRAHCGKGVVRIAIDEAHCISQWGHDFRPEYRQMDRLRESFPKASIQAFTATATPQVRDDIEQQLGFKRSKRFIGVFDRPNLTYRIVPKENSRQVIVDAVRRYPDEAVIVYCISRKDTDAMAEALKVEGLNAAAYHAGLDAKTRRKISEDFARERLNVVVATVAFGMGIDRANVRCVIHDSMPKSIEGYQQETGRAGRDGLPSECIMLYSNGDVMRWQRVMKMSGGSHLPHQLKLLDEVRRFAMGTQCRHAFLSNYFGQRTSPNCRACDVCLDGQAIVEGSTKIVHKILVTVNDLLQLRGTFGLAHLADVLVGSNLKAIRQRGHDRVRGFGCLKKIERGRVQAWLHQIVDLELLAVSDSEFPVIEASEAGQQVLRDRAEVELRDTAAIGGKSSRRLDEIGEDQSLFNLLREERKKIAAEREVPAYVVFHDAVLQSIARSKPTTIPQVVAIAGVGEKRAADFGERFLSIVRNYQAPRTTPSRSEETLEKYHRHFDEGCSIIDVAAICGVTDRTAANYLALWISDRKPKEIDFWVSEPTYSKILTVAREVGTDKMKPIKEILPEVDYIEIGAVLAHGKAIGTLV